FGILSFSSGITTTQAGIPVVSAGTAFRVFVENGPGIRSGVAIANQGADPVEVLLETDGLRANISINGSGQTAVFLNDLPGLSTLPASFQGVMQLTSSAPVAVSGLRSHSNERGEVLMTATAPLSESGSGDSGQLFVPQFADGGGYSTEFVLFGRPTSGTLSFFDPAGNLSSPQFR